MQILTDIYPPEIKPVRDGWYLAAPAFLRPEPPSIGFFSTWRFSDGAWRLPNNGECTIKMHWIGLAFDPESAELVDKFSDASLPTPGRLMPKVSVVYAGPMAPRKLKDDDDDQPA